MSEKESVQMAENEAGLETIKKVDTVHGDEAGVILANYTGEQEWTDAEENKLRRKVDWKLMPVMCITYGLQYYDKAMLSQAVSRVDMSSSPVLSPADTPNRPPLGCAQTSV